MATFYDLVTAIENEGITGYVAYDAANLVDPAYYLDLDEDELKDLVEQIVVEEDLEGIFS
jgi:hypothetical protein